MKTGDYKTLLRGVGQIDNKKSAKAHKKPDEIEFFPYAWERLEQAVDKVAKS